MRLVDENQKKRREKEELEREEAQRKRRERNLRKRRQEAAELTHLLSDYKEVSREWRVLKDDELVPQL